MALCSVCKKRVAIVYTSRYENGKRIDEGYCIKCAYDSGIGGISDMFKAAGINEDNIDEMSEKVEDMMGSSASADPTDFLKSLVDGNFPDMDGVSDSDGEDNFYEFDEDSSSTGVADAEPKKDNSNDDDAGDDEGEEEKPSNPFGALFGGQQKTNQRKKGRRKLRYLNEFGTNLTQRAKENKIDRIIGRDKEIDRVIQILNRRTKNNPVLIGQPGVGKTAVAQGLALKIVEGNVPAKLLDMQVWQLDLPAMVAGTQFRGQFESRMKGVINEAMSHENVILVIDELHTIMGAGDSEGSTNAANILKPALARGELRILGSTTTAEYRKIEKDSALERRFQKVMLDEPSVETSIEILKGIKDYYEKHHNVYYSDEVIEFAVKASKRYITDRFLPDKAIDLIDEAGSRANLANVKLVKLAKCETDLKAAEKALKELEDEMENPASTSGNLSQEDQNKQYEKLAALKADRERLKNQYSALTDDIKPDPITNEDIARVVEMWTGIPMKSISETETEKLIHLEENLHKRVVGQEEAVHAVSAAVRRNRSGFAKKHKPASFIFVGPTGVGKTELVKSLAEVMFDTEEALVRVDMSEYMEAHSVSKLIGSPPGYVGHDDAGQLTEQIRRKPYSVILFDEIEKAHPDVFNILLQVLDDGRLTDSHGIHVNFENTIIVMTSNAGSSAKNPTIGFFSDSGEALESRVKSALRETFRPEFLNRVDEVVIFNELKKSEIRSIVDIMIKDVVSELKEKGISCTLTGEAADYLCDIGYDPKYGARPLRKAIRTKIEDALADMFLAGELNNVSAVTIDHRDGDSSMTFTTTRISEDSEE